MDFGIFMEVEIRRGGDQATAFRDGFELVDAAEAWASTVQVLPLNNPLRIAEEAATVDQISAGRFDFGIGRSGFPRVYDLYGIPYAESQARFREALEIILEAWKGEPFSYKGQ